MTAHRDSPVSLDTGPSGGADIHRRVFGHYIHLLLLSLTAALPHVTGFPGLGVLRRLRPTHTLRQATHLSPRSGERNADGSHVHCCSVDGRGIRLYPCGIVVATP